MALTGTRTTLSKDEYETLILKGIHRPVSMFESCLRHPPEEQLTPGERQAIEDKKKENDSKGPTVAEKIEIALAKDQTNFEKKYGGGVGRYVAKLPVGPQHLKFSHQHLLRRGATSKSAGAEADADQDGIPSAAPSTPEPKTGPRFNIPTLRKWFSDIDVNGSGSITRRELIVALRQNPDLQALLLSTSANADLAGKGESEDAPGTSSITTTSSIRQQHNEMKRIMQIMHEVDTDGSGSMEWEEFVEFFRRSGYLLEYNTRKILNDTSFRSSADRAQDEAFQNADSVMTLDDRIRKSPEAPGGNGPDQQKDSKLRRGKTSGLAEFRRTQTLQTLDGPPVEQQQSKGIQERILNDTSSRSSVGSLSQSLSGPSRGQDSKLELMMHYDELMGRVAGLGSDDSRKLGKEVDVDAAILEASRDAARLRQASKT